MVIDFKNLNINSLISQTEFENKVISFIKCWFSESEKLSVQTSGSTGKPKIFDIEKEKMRHSAKMTCDFLDLKEGDSALLCLPVEYISGKMMVVRSIERKLKLRIEEPSLTPLKNLEETIDFCAMTPLQVENSLDKIHLIRKLIIGGAAVSESLKKKIFEVRSSKSEVRRIYETYGMSETLSHIALKQIFPKEELYFTVFEGIKISQDERGCLNIFAPQLNSETLQTNDIVEIVDKTHFRFLGRADNIINSGGAKIFPEELEAIVKKHIPNEVVFLGIPDETLGQKLILVVEGTENEELNRQLSTINYQPKFHKPKETIFIEKIPRTPNGKVNRRELQNLIMEQ